MINSTGRVENRMLGKIDEINSKLEESQYVFHLTGSRFFGNDLYDSDYDYFVAYSDGVISFLASLGFVQDTRTDYVDSMLERIMTYRWGNVKLFDVQIIKPAQLESKIIAQKILAGPLLHEYNRRPAQSYSRTLLWNAAQEIIPIVRDYYGSEDYAY